MPKEINTILIGLLLILVFNIATYTIVLRHNTQISYKVEKRFDQLKSELDIQTKDCSRFSHYLDYGERYVMYDLVEDKEVARKTRLAGVYNPSTEVTCIWLEDYDNETLCHEGCHDYIANEQCFDKDKDPISCEEHFCKEEK